MLSLGVKGLNIIQCIDYLSEWHLLDLRSRSGLEALSFRLLNRLGIYSCSNLHRHVAMQRKDFQLDGIMSCFSCFGLTSDQSDGVDVTGTPGDDDMPPRPGKRPEEILRRRNMCRQFPVKETDKLIRTQDENGNKMINEYIREYKIGAGSYGKVVLYRSSIDEKHYAIKAFHKSYLLKLRVAPSETAMNDVIREVMIMKMLDHPNIVNLIEVINDPDTDHFYMVLEYVEGKWVCEGCGPPGGLGETRARRYLRDIVSGLMYLHAHNIIHGDIKPDNLLVTRTGRVKIGDFSVSQVFEDDDDELRRSPGTPVFTAPECCLGLTYHGKAADTWAVGVTLYCMVFGRYPFLGDTLQDTYDKIVSDPLVLPENVSPQLKGLLSGLLCKDPKQRMSLETVAEHIWLTGEDGPIPEYICWCKRKALQAEECDDRNFNMYESI